MNCPNCGQQNAEASSFCTSCGAALSAEPTEEEGTGQEAEGDARSEDTSLAELRSQMRVLQQEIGEIRIALLGYFSMRSQPSAQEVVRVLQQRQPAPTCGAEREPQRARGEASPPVERDPMAAYRVTSAGPTRSVSAAGRALWERIQVDWEVVLGGNWMARIGVLAVVIGMGFFLKLAFENNWIGETGRVVLGIVSGLLFLGASEFWHKRYPAYAQALAGGGVALLYLSIFAAFAIFGLITLYPAIGILLLISVTSAALALRHESVSLAIIGIAGAFVAPFATGGFAPTTQEVDRAGPSIQLMVYVIGVDVGVLALSTFRNWR